MTEGLTAWRAPNSLRVSPIALVTLAVGAEATALATWAHTAGDAWTYFLHVVPNGQFLYVLSKAMGLSAVVLVWNQMLLGLAITARRDIGAAVSARWHRGLGVAALGALLLHWATFFGASSLRIGAPALDYLVPEFSHGFYRSVVSLGILSLIIIVIGATAAGFRGRLHSWRVLHWLTTLGAMGGAVHSYLIGSESRMSPMKALYAFMLVTLALAWVARLGKALRCLMEARMRQPVR